MWSKTSNEPLQEYLEDSSSDEAVEQPDNSIVYIPERSDPDLHDENEEDRYQSCE